MSRRAFIAALPLLAGAVFALSSFGGSASASGVDLLASARGPLLHATSSVPTSSAAQHFVVAPTGNEARYRVREQLAGLDFPNDAVGATSAITGAIVVESDGRMVRDQSKITVDLRPLKSDKDRRDGYIQRRTLQTAEFPTVELVPTAVRGLTLTAPFSGAKSFELMGDLTIKGVTKPTTWTVTAQFDGARVTGTAATTFSFEEFGLAKPRVASVLSVADSIRLEYDFTLVAEGAGAR